MIWFLRMFTAFTDLDALSQTQASALETEIRTHEDTKQQLHERIVALESERVRRIAAETVASERREEIDRLATQYREIREDLSRVNAERLKSVDALNVKLMREGVPELPPDMEKLRRHAADGAMMKVVQSARQNDRIVDRLLLERLHPAFKKGVTVNEPVLPVDEVAA